MLSVTEPTLVEYDDGGRVTESGVRVYSFGGQNRLHALPDKSWEYISWRKRKENGHNPVLRWHARQDRLSDHWGNAKGTKCIVRGFRCEHGRYTLDLNR